MTKDIICEDKFGGQYGHLDHEDGELDSLAWAGLEPGHERMSSQERQRALVLPVVAQGVAGIFLWEVVCGEKVSGLKKTLLTDIPCLQTELA